ncbi:RNA polymerase sigma factor [Halobacillus fulvus]|nr:RNA polymerase sigma factor [Halobacillus fulvus]
MFDHYAKELKKYCYALTGTPWDGDDLFQQTYVKAMNYTETLENHSAPKAYLFRIASSLWRDLLRKNKEHPTDPFSIKSYGTEDITLYEGIDWLVSLLPDKQASCFLLIEYFGFTAKETSNILSCSESDVKISLHRARQTLREANRKQNEPVPSLIDRFVRAIREQNHQLIASTFQILIHHGVIVKVQDRWFSFEVTDPFGNMLTFQEKI